MAYATTDIIEWAKISQSLASIGEAKRLALQGKGIQSDLDMKLYVERMSLEWEYAQDPSSDNLYQIGNWVLALCGIYLFKAQFLSGNPGGQVPGVSPSSLPTPKFFIVSASSYMVTGASSATINDFTGYNLIFTRGGIPQSTVTSEPTYFTWNPTTAAFTCSPALVVDELIGLIPV